MSFIFGVLVGTVAGALSGGLVYVLAYNRLKRLDDAFRQKTEERLEAFAGKAQRGLDLTRRELGLPPRLTD